MLRREGLDLVGIAILGLPVLACVAWVGVLLAPYVLEPYARALTTVLLRRAVRRGTRLRPVEPWTWGTEGDERGVRRPLGHGRRGRWWLALGLGMVFVGVPLWTTGVPAAVVAVFVGLPGAVLAWLGYRYVRAGSVRLAWHTRPLVTGGRAEFTLGVSDGGARFESATVRLRSIEEHPSRAHLIWCTWTDVVEFAREFAPGPGHDVFVAFDIPAEAPGTRIDVREACWWELEVTGTSDAGPIGERFVVPIYDPPPPDVPPAA